MSQMVQNLAPDLADARVATTGSRVSIRAMAAVWKHCKAGGVELLVMLAIADRADDEGAAYPSLQTLATKIRMSPRNTRYLISKLEKSGELEIERNAGPHGCNLFRVKCLDTPAKIAPLQPMVNTPASCGNLPLQTVAPNTSIIHQRDMRNGEALAQFWSAYPKRKDKARAKIAFAKLDPDDELVNRMLEAIELSKASRDWREDNGKYIPHPTTWLNGKRWEDEQCARFAEKPRLAL